MSASDPPNYEPEPYMPDFGWLDAAEAGPGGIPASVFFSDHAPPPAPTPPPPAPSPPAPAPPAPPPPAPLPPEAAPAPDATARAPVSREFVRKAELEAAMQAAPLDRTLRTAYFELLAGLAVAGTGLLWAHLPELEAPLALRAATPDVAVLGHVFQDGMFDVQMHATPVRILLIGAHVGYAAVDLARRFPRANIVACEPLPDNFRLLALNTGAWRRIRVEQVAVWHSSTRLSPTARLQGDWSVWLTDEALEAELTVTSLSMKDLLERVGWNYADMIVCDATGGERAIFADPLSPWLRGCDALLVRLYEQHAPGSEAVVAAAFPSETFERRRIGELDLFARRIPRRAEPPLPATQFLIRPDPGHAPFDIADMPAAPWGFFVFDGTSFQLHPNGTRGVPARARFTITARGHTRFISGVTHAGSSGVHAIVFTVLVVAGDGTVAGRASQTVGAQRSARLTLLLPDLPAPYYIILQAEMEPGAQNNQMAWARFIDPRVV